MLLLFLLSPPGPGPALWSGFINIRIPKFIRPAASTTDLSLTSEQIQLGAVSPCICGVTATSSKLTSSIPSWSMAAWATAGSCWREEQCPSTTWGYPSELRDTEMLMGTHCLPHFFSVLTTFRLRIFQDFSSAPNSQLTKSVLLSLTQVFCVCQLDQTAWIFSCKHQTQSPY